MSDFGSSLNSSSEGDEVNLHEIEKASRHLRECVIRHRQAQADAICIQARVDKATYDLAQAVKSIDALYQVFEQEEAAAIILRRLKSKEKRERLKAAHAIIEKGAPKSPPC
mgnify:CR=1 FL=1